MEALRHNEEPDTEEFPNNIIASAYKTLIREKLVKRNLTYSLTKRGIDYKDFEEEQLPLFPNWVLWGRNRSK